MGDGKAANKSVFDSVGMRKGGMGEEMGEDDAPGTVDAPGVRIDHENAKGAYPAISPVRWWFIAYFTGVTTTIGMILR